MLCKYIFEAFNKEEASEKFCLQIIFTYIYIYNVDKTICA